MAKERKTICCETGMEMTKRDAILMAAKAEFMDNGYAATSMDAVSARANVSKATVYAHFESKKCLFEAVIRARCSDVFAPLELPDTLDDPRVALVQFGERIMTMMVSADALAMFRLILSEVLRHPEVGEVFYAVGPAMAQNCLADVFERLKNKGLLNVPASDAQMVSNLFVGMLKGDIHLRALLGQSIDPADIRRAAAMAADLVVSRYGMRGR